MGEGLTRSREGRLEYRQIFSIVRHAIPTSDTPITASKHDATSPDTKLGEHVADGGGIVLWHGLFVLSVRGRESLGNRRFTREGFEPVEVRLVVVFCWTPG